MSVIHSGDLSDIAISGSDLYLTSYPNVVKFDLTNPGAPSVHYAFQNPIANDNSLAFLTLAMYKTDVVVGLRLTEKLGSGFYKIASSSITRFIGGARGRNDLDVIMYNQTVFGSIGSMTEDVNGDMYIFGRFLHASC